MMVDPFPVIFSHQSFTFASKKLYPSELSFLKKEHLHAQGADAKLRSPDMGQRKSIYSE
jgi:hypothetical protein